MLYEKAKDLFLEDFKSVTSANFATPVRLLFGLKLHHNLMIRTNGPEGKVMQW